MYLFFTKYFAKKLGCEKLTHVKKKFKKYRKGILHFKKFPTYNFMCCWKIKIVSEFFTENFTKNLGTGKLR